MAIEPPTNSAEQLAQWQALVERVRQGDRSQIVAWDEVAAARTIAGYRVLATQQVHRRLRDAPPCWPDRSLASSPSFGWIPLRPV